MSPALARAIAALREAELFALEARYPPHAWIEVGHSDCAVPNPRTLNGLIEHRLVEVTSDERGHTIARWRPAE